jgi:hypothetical protein
MTRDADADTQSTRSAEQLWLRIQEDMFKAAPARVVDGGKQVITLSTVLAGAYFTGTAFTTLGFVESPYLRAAYLVPILLWVVAILFAVPAAIPLRRYEANLGDALAAKDLFVKMVPDRLWHLRVALLIQTLGIIAMLIVLWLRLSNKPTAIGISP